ncbi:L-threonylcarbamoyladenylate synthase [Celeribacter marinus]|uniref:L-threonylcarbamoyladenylate synthase n=1 Tax=Celeribacter marinus TaxID=1397108 RepID=A0A0P0A8W6_9RHOB|nr:L-threonylcarbamoyladenylate synthase [Celeribacter marinus]ALI54955.1 TsaC protein (YrdC domain) required for threonylcarbamoyladenosine t(6)A37 modification in tRNA [Celeribacter marinus]SFK02991.1 L-threonylcarbamoyladenylate synthase [Celeribacter marinus]
MTPSVIEIADCLKAGGVVLLPTDTVLGLAVSPQFDASVAQLYALKDRPREKNLPVMVADADQIEALGAYLTTSAKRLIASEFVPGAITLVMELGPDTPAWLSGRDEIAVRIPDDDRLRAVLRETGPLLVTSANRSGCDTPHTAQDASAQLTATPSMVVDGTGHAGAPSTIVNCRVWPPEFIRIGAVSTAQIMALMEADQ